MKEGCSHCESQEAFSDTSSFPLLFHDKDKEKDRDRDKDRDKDKDNGSELQKASSNTSSSPFMVGECNFA